MRCCLICEYCMYPLSFCPSLPESLSCFLSFTGFSYFLGFSLPLLFCYLYFTISFLYNISIYIYIYLLYLFLFLSCPLFFIPPNLLVIFHPSLSRPLSVSPFPSPLSTYYMYVPSLTLSLSHILIPSSTHYFHYNTQESS